MFQQENDYNEKDNNKGNFEGRTSSQGKGRKVMSDKKQRDQNKNKEEK